MVLLGPGGGHSAAGDWPQILGPNRNGIAAEDERLLERWPSAGPNTVWQREVGSGFAGVAVAGERVFVFHRLAGEEVLESLNAATGETLWKQSTPTTFYPSVGGGDGPLCVPTVAGDVVVSFGAQGVLTACDAATGRVLWQRFTHKDFSAQEGYFGAGSTPVVAGDVVIVNVGGGREDAGIVGFELRTGKTAWTRTSEQASYSAPIVREFSGIPVAIVVTRLKCVALEPKTGTILWQFPFGQRGPTVNGATPLLLDNHLFVTSSYGIGATYAEVGVAGFKTAWQKDGLLSSQYATPIEHEGLLYGIHGREDVPPADLVCIDPKTQKVLWTESNFGYATLIKADGKLIAVKTDGELLLIEPTAEGFRVRSRARVFSGTVRALPALSNGGLYVRDERVLKRLDVSGR